MVVFNHPHGFGSTPLPAQVNKRVAKEELTDLSGDRLFPKVQWPPPELCPLCRLPSLATAAAAESAAREPEWNEDEVFRFLVRFYGDDGRVDAAAHDYGGSRCAACASLLSGSFMPAGPSLITVSREAEL